MPLTKKMVDRFGYASISIMVVMLLLLWFDIVSRSLTISFFIVALVLFGVRLALRVRLVQMERRAMKAKQQGNTSS